MVKSKKNLKQFHTKNSPLKKTNLKRKKINLDIKKASHDIPTKTIPENSNYFANFFAP